MTSRGATTIAVTLGRPSASMCSCAVRFGYERHGGFGFAEVAIGLLMSNGRTHVEH